MVDSTLTDLMLKIVFLSAAALLSCAALAKNPAGPVPATKTASIATLKVEAPFVVTSAVEEALLSADTWAEVYRVPVGQQKAALEQLVRFNQTPTPLGVAIAGKLHLKAKGRPVQLEESTVVLSRGGVALAYDEQCKTVPAAGDRLEAVYSSDADTTVTIVGTVLEHFAFGPLSPLASDSVRLPRVTAENCQSLQESRILYEGELTIRSKGALTHREPVLMQSVLQ